MWSVDLFLEMNRKDEHFENRMLFMGIFDEFLEIREVYKKKKKKRLKTWNRAPPYTHEKLQLYRLTEKKLPVWHCGLWAKITILQDSY